jgi:hypothetical protein
MIEILKTRWLTFIANEWMCFQCLAMPLVMYKMVHGAELRYK